MLTIKFNENLMNDIEQFIKFGREFDLKSFYYSSETIKGMVLASMLIYETQQKIGKTKSCTFKRNDVEMGFDIYRIKTVCEKSKNKPENRIVSDEESSIKPKTIKVYQGIITFREVNWKRREITLELLQEKNFFKEEKLFDILSELATKERKHSQNLEFFYKGLNFMGLSKFHFSSVKYLPILYKSIGNVYPIFKDLEIEDRIKILNMTQFGKMDRGNIVKKIWEVLCENGITSQYKEIIVSEDDDQIKEVIWTLAFQKIEFYISNGNQNKRESYLLYNGDHVRIAQIKEKYRAEGWYVYNQIIRFVTYSRVVPKNGVTIQKTLNYWYNIRPFLKVLGTGEKEL